MATSYLEHFSVRELMALLFLVEEGKNPDELKAGVFDSEFLKRWQEAEHRFKALVKYYPEEDEEKFYFLATLDAVHGIDPFSDGALRLRDKYKEAIEFLMKR